MDEEEEPKEVQQQTRWTAAEETCLATCWVAVSESNEIGSDRGFDSFWWQVLEYFNESSPVQRTNEIITRKWVTMNDNCQRFNAIYKRFNRLGPKSGVNETGLLARCRAAFREELEQKVYSRARMAYIQDPPQMGFA
ncbi:hypothetical protein Tco_0340928 [Tanacetum coccineum]